MEVKNHDFVEIDYTGTAKEDNLVFDTTEEKVAKDSGFYKEGTEYKPAVICVGERQVVPGIDSQIVGKEVGKEYTFNLQPDDAFGRKNAKLLQLIPASRFKKDSITPFPGMQVSIDDNMGIIRTVSGGRILVDFNHPLAGKEVSYRVKVNRLVDNDEEKVSSLLSMLGMKNAHVHAGSNGEVEVVFGQGIPPELSKVIEDNVKKLVPSVKKLSFVSEKDHKHVENPSPANAARAKPEAEKKDEPKQQTATPPGAESATAKANEAGEAASHPGQEAGKK